MLTVIGSMLTGGDSIDDVGVLRAGAAASLFDGAPLPAVVHDEAGEQVQRAATHPPAPAGRRRVHPAGPLVRWGCPVRA